MFLSKSGSLMASNILIMTSTVRPPPGTPNMVRLDPALRMADYKSALTFYLKQLGKEIDQIIFAENSGADTSILREVVAERGQDASVNFHACYGLNYPPVYGRCYGELRLLDEIMSSPIVASLPSNAMFWKVTGRYKITNLAAMIRSRPAEVDFYCDMRTTGPRPWLDMRFMAWTRQGYEAVLREVFERVREDENRFRPGEEKAFEVIKPRLLKTRSWTYWVREPRIDGIRAYDGRSYIRGRQLVVFWLRNLQRRTIGRPIF